MVLLCLALCLWQGGGYDDVPLDYFLLHRTVRGQVLDRASNPEIVSVAAGGFGMAAWAVAAGRGRLPRDTAIRWVGQCLDSTLADNVGNHGWLYHFTDVAGRPASYRLVSSIDTTLFYLGARDAAARLNHPPLAARVEGLIRSVDVVWMLSDGGASPAKRFFSHGFSWDGGTARFNGYDWRYYSEGVLIYRLFGVAYECPPIDYDLPLFVFYYPLAFFPDDEMLIRRLGRALDRQIATHGLVGMTACDGPGGYGVMEPGIVSPLALATCERYFPTKVRRALARLPGPTLPSYKPATGWRSGDRIAIDDGAYVLIRNRR